MKKLIILLITLLLTATLCACGGGGGTGGGGGQCQHKADEDSVASKYYERTTATCSQGGIEYYNCVKCGEQEAVEIEVEAYDHLYQLGNSDQTNFKCIWCDETQITLNPTSPKEVITNYGHGNIPIASKMQIKNVNLLVYANDFDFTYSTVTLSFDVEATEIANPSAVYKYLICFSVKDELGNVVWKGEAKANNHEYGERDLKVGDEFTALASCGTRYLEGFDYNKKCNWTVEIVDSVIIDYSDGNRIENV